MPNICMYSIMKFVNGVVRVRFFSLMYWILIMAVIPAEMKGRVEKACHLLYDTIPCYANSPAQYSHQLFLNNLWTIARVVLRSIFNSNLINCSEAENDRSKAEFSSEEDIDETPHEKKKRLSRKYLEQLERKGYTISFHTLKKLNLQ